jgi:hypothetical protein
MSFNRIGEDWYIGGTLSAVAFYGDGSNLTGVSGGTASQGTSGTSGTTFGTSGTRGTSGTSGTRGTSGTQGRSAGIQYNFITSTTNADPGATNFKFRGSGTLSSTNNILISVVDVDNIDQTTWLSTLTNGYLILRSNNNTGTNFAVLTITSTTLVTSSPYNYYSLNVDITYTTGNWLLSSPDLVVLNFSKSGGTGTSGTRGTSGTTGTSGTRGTSGTGFSSISTPGNNRVLTSDGATNSAVAETNLTFDGSILTVTGDVVVSGDLTISGTTSIVNTQNLLVKDPLILLASTQSGTPVLDSGIMISRGTGATQAFIWDESVDEFAVISTNNSALTYGNLTISGYSNLRVGGLTVSQIKIFDGTQGTGKYLISDINGLASWTASAGPTSSGSNNQIQLSDGLGKFKPYGFFSTASNNTVITNTASTTLVGIDNTLVGINSGWKNSGSSNTFIGSSAGYNNATGSNNIYIGNSSGLSATSSNYNITIGDLSGFYNKSSNSVFIGANAGYKNDGGLNNTYIGYNSGAFAGTYSYIDQFNFNEIILNTCNNTFIGYNSGYYGSAIQNNTFIGYNSGYNSSAGFDPNDFSGYPLKADYNTFIGSESGYSNIYGSGNTFIGYRSGWFNTSIQVVGANPWDISMCSGYNNVFIGSDSGFSNKIGSNNTFIGFNAGYSGTQSGNSTFIGTCAGRLNTANYNTFVGAVSGRVNTTGTYNSFFGDGAGYNNTTGSCNTFIGMISGCCTTTGGHNTFIGNRSAAANINGTGNVILGSDAMLTGNYSCVISIGACSLPSADGQFIIGSTTYPILTGTTASLGSNGDVPVQVSRYMCVVLNGTEYKIPLYN